MRKSILVTGGIILVIILALLAALWWYMAAHPKTSNPNNLLTVNSCSSIQPKSLQISRGSDINIENADTAAHSLVFGSLSISVNAGETTTTLADFPNQTESYPIVCDGAASNSQISVIDGPQIPSTQTASSSFKDAYDSMALDMQTCIKGALGAEFDKAYSSTTYQITQASLDKMTSCAPKPFTSDITFKTFYDASPANIKTCLTAALGDEFSSLYDNPGFHPTEQHTNNMVACLNTK